MLEGVRGVDFTQFRAGDVVRHALVQRIVEAYHRFEAWRFKIRCRAPRIPATRAGCQLAADASRRCCRTDIATDSAARTRFGRGAQAEPLTQDAVSLAVRLVGLEGARPSTRPGGKRGLSDQRAGLSGEPPMASQPLEYGNLVLCAPGLVTREAAEQGKGPIGTWPTWSVHGTRLHLLGHTHDDQADLPGATWKPPDPGPRKTGLVLIRT